jgi:hypothetical protein
MATPDRKIFLGNPQWLPSLESLFGWHSQYERMMRWHDRLKRDPSLDLLLTFFLNCYALRHWLAKSSTLAAHVVDAEIDKSFPMRLCRDLCNRSKHLTINRPSVDADFAITMEYRGESRPAGIVVLAGGVKSDLHETADQCVAFWHHILPENGLRF